MKPEEFVNSIKELVINENLNIYKDLFETTNVDDVTDLYWKNALSFFRLLSDSQKSVFYQILRQVEVDTVSNIFAVLDGVTFLEGQERDFILEYEGKKVNVDLQDIFLESEED
ncbi:hypothetical protein [Maribacter sp. 2-571]|uniref:hypothetical protein n=1 Tax=Maribacter sp. 2-571 TaxID=3417569 RepID=UPI003D347C6F